MTKSILLILCALSFTVSNAQISKAVSYYDATFTAKSTPDTTVNTDTTYLYWDMKDQIGDLYFDIITTKLTGTAGGTIILQGSYDGTTWINVINDSSQAVITTTYTISNTTHAYYILKMHPFIKYRVRLIYSGTQTSVCTGSKLWYRKRQ